MVSDEADQGAAVQIRCPLGNDQIMPTGPVRMPSVLHGPDELSVCNLKRTAYTLQQTLCQTPLFKYEYPQTFICILFHVQALLMSRPFFYPHDTLASGSAAFNREWINAFGEARTTKKPGTKAPGF
ncbi:MAG: hypothetical protein A2516_07040 [Alphaproteobacteria bacterium RIFOXYD12_FULL_60_8]|nr:MAG: hypothetical protein A2516_07040 [Alphaproteobacteria bacterium RIFOXYD12_FULL_60_8]